MENNGGSKEEAKYKNPFGVPLDYCKNELEEHLRSYFFNLQYLFDLLNEREETEGIAQLGMLVIREEQNSLGKLAAILEKEFGKIEVDISAEEGPNLCDRQILGLTVTPPEG